MVSVGFDSEWVSDYLSRYDRADHLLRDLHDVLVTFSEQLDPVAHPQPQDRVQAARALAALMRTKFAGLGWEKVAA